MVVIRDEARIARLKRIGRILNILGIICLGGGMLVAVISLFSGPENSPIPIEDIFLYQFLALFLGWTFSQIGLYLAHRYIRHPRPDEVIDMAVRKVAKNGRLYHYVLPAPHVLLLPSGIVLFNAKYQPGTITVDGDKWKQTGIGLRKWFGQDGIGNPTKEAEAYVKMMADFIGKEIPEIEEVPMLSIIVFTNKLHEGVDFTASRLPAMQYKQLRGFLRRQRNQPKLAAGYFDKLQAAFDKQAAFLDKDEQLAKVSG